MRLIVSEAAYVHKMLWRALVWRDNLAPYGNTYRENCAVVVKIQTADNFPCYTRYSVTILTLRNDT